MTKKCVVYFEPGLPDEEVLLCIQAIHRFRGVERVETHLTHRVPAKNPEDPAEEEEPEDQSPPPPQIKPSSHDPQLLATKRQLIDHVLKWGLREGKISLELLQSMSAEEVVALSMDLLGRMPPELQDKIRQKLDVTGQL